MKRLRALVLNLSGIECRYLSKMQHSLIHKASINKKVSGFFDILIGCRDICI